MNGLDRMFLNVESDRLPMDMFGILMLDPSTAPDGHDYQRFRAELSARIPRVPVFTRRPVTAPFGAGHEHWVIDPDFSVDRHLKHLGVPAPYDLSALCDLAMSLGNEPMKRDRPLWQMYYVDGLDDGSAAVLIRLHHAAIDGVGGTEMLRELFDTEALPVNPALAPGAVGGERVPSQPEMLLRSMPDQIVTPIRLVRHGLPVILPVAKSLLSRLTTTSTAPAAPSTRKPSAAPSRSLFNRPTKSPRRSLAVVSLPMVDMKIVKDRFGVTLNDVVLSITSGAITDYLRNRDELPDSPLKVAGPVNIRDESAESGSGNHFTFMMVAIPDIADPVERLKTVASMTRNRKPARTAAGANTTRKPTGAGLGQVMRLIDAIPGGAWVAVRELINSPAVEAIPPITNYVVSNIPGPTEKLYIAGAQITNLYGRTMVGAGIGLFIHCLSYGNTLDFGFTALAELIPDPDKIAIGMQDQLSKLLRAEHHPPVAKATVVRHDAAKSSTSAPH
ncbi:MAG: wax ester/triacylglycerol synthase family O-acyltransferase [Mycobacterium sp.]